MSRRTVGLVVAHVGNADALESQARWASDMLADAVVQQGVLVYGLTTSKEADGSYSSLPWMMRGTAVIVVVCYVVQGIQSSIE